jgi:cyclopropane-fatty-acyl-phospholipid synthase
MKNTVAKKLFLGSLQRVREGFLEVLCPGETHRFGDPGPLQALLAVHDERFFARAVFEGEVGMGESYMDGDWSSPDLVEVVRLAVRNMSVLEERETWTSFVSRWANRLRHRLRNNSVAGSRKNIREHYDLSNDFFRLFLDRNMLYSSAWYETAGDSLETAQVNKIDRICRKLQLRPGDRVLEIGTGWGAFALHAARNYGCRVTTTTISRAQHDYAKSLFDSSGLPSGSIELLFDDYRKLGGRYDKIVSIEMFEAVGLRHYREYFDVCDRLLEPDGSMLLQTITMNEQKFASYIRGGDWIQRHIFPGGELASVLEVIKVLGTHTRLSLFHLEDMGIHYARTLEAWRARFHEALPRVRAMGFGDRFIRMWDFYLAYCQGAFEERHISDVQLLLTKTGNRSRLLNEPRGREPELQHASVAAC